MSLTRDYLTYKKFSTREFLSGNEKNEFISYYHT